MISSHLDVRLRNHQQQRHQASSLCLVLSPLKCQDLPPKLGSNTMKWNCKTMYMVTSMMKVKSSSKMRRERERERINITLRMCARFTCKVWYSSTILWRISLHLEEYTSSRKRLWEKFCELWKEYLTLKRYSAVCEKKKMEKRVSLKRNGKTEENRLIQLNSRLMPLLISQKMSLIGLKEERNTWGNHSGIKIKKYMWQSFWN